MPKMGFFDRIKRLFCKKKAEEPRKKRRKVAKREEVKKKNPPKKEVLMPGPWSKVEKYKKVKTNNSSGFLY